MESVSAGNSSVKFAVKEERLGRRSKRMKESMELFFFLRWRRLTENLKKYLGAPSHPSPTPQTS